MRVNFQLLIDNKEIKELINNKKSTSENVSNQFMLTKKRKIRWEKKMLQVMRLLDLAVEIFYLVILNELTIKCVIRFGRFVRIF